MGIYPLQDLANENYISIHPNMETDVIFCERKEWIGIEERSSA